MYHIVYLTTNLVNNKIYVGVHSTYNLNDGYLGSGLVFKQATKKYGESNFKRQILHYCLESKDAYELESKIVNENFIKRQDVYNIKLGGSGSFSHINLNKEIYSSEYFRIKFNNWYNSLSEEEKLSKRPHMFGKDNPMYGKTHTKETKEKTKHAGDKNPNSYVYLKNVKGLTDKQIKEERTKHISYKKYKIININTNEVIEGEISLKQWCKDNNLSYDSVYPKVKNNKYNVNGVSISRIP